MKKALVLFTILFSLPVWAELPYIQKNVCQGELCIEFMQKRMKGQVVSNQDLYFYLHPQKQTIHQIKHSKERPFKILSYELHTIEPYKHTYSQKEQEAQVCRNSDPTGAPISIGAQISLLSYVKDGVLLGKHNNHLLECRFGPDTMDLFRKIKNQTWLHVQVEQWKYWMPLGDGCNLFVHRKTPLPSHCAILKPI